MADFYVNYGSKGAILKAYYKCGSVTLRLHMVRSYEFVLSKNRKILSVYDNLDKSLNGFHNAIYLESLQETLFNI